MRKKVTYFLNWEQMPICLTPEDVARLLNKNVQIIRKYAREKTIPATKVGKCWHFNREEIRKIVEGSCVT